MDWRIGLAAFGACQVAAFVLLARAYRRLSSKGAGQPFGTLLRGSLAGPDYFTPDGWRYRRWANAISIGGVLLLGVLLLLG